MVQTKIASYSLHPATAYQTSLSLSLPCCDGSAGSLLLISNCQPAKEEEGHLNCSENQFGARGSRGAGRLWNLISAGKECYGALQVKEKRLGRGSASKENEIGFWCMFMYPEIKPINKLKGHVSSSESDGLIVLRFTLTQTHTPNLQCVSCRLCLISVNTVQSSSYSLPGRKT